MTSVFKINKAILLVLCVLVLSSCSTVNHHRQHTDNSLQDIKKRGVLLVGTAGDYRPLTFVEPDGRYWGYDIELAQIIAQRLDVAVQFVPTSWPTLTADVMSQPQKFDLAIGGITITPQRQELMLMSQGYLVNGKTIICRSTDATRFQSLSDIDRPEVRVMINPGGTNEQFALSQLSHATIIVHPHNEEIPTLIAEGKADVMVTEITEAPYYVSTDSRLASPLIATPFTHSQIGILMSRDKTTLLNAVDTILQQLTTDGTLRRLHEKYFDLYAIEE